jgi:ATP-binding cassette subfamily B protein
VIIVGMVIAAISRCPMAAGAYGGRIVDAIRTMETWPLAHNALLVLGSRHGRIHAQMGPFPCLANHGLGQYARSSRRHIRTCSTLLVRLAPQYICRCNRRKVTRGKWAYDAMSDIFFFPGKKFFHFLQLGLVVLGITTVMLFRFPIVGALFLFTVVVYIAISTWLAVRYVRARPMSDPLKLTARLARPSQTALPTTRLLKPLVLSNEKMGLFWRVVDRWSGLARVFVEPGQDLAAAQQLLWILLQLSTIFVLIELAKADQATPGDVTFVLTVNFMLGGRLRQVGDHIPTAAANTSEFVMSLRDFHKRPPRCGCSRLPRISRTEHGHIEFDRVTFRLRPVTSFDLRRLSIDIKPGEGSVWCASALASRHSVKLIQRLYDVSGGGIRHRWTGHR